MQKQNVGRLYPPRPAFMSLDMARDLAGILGIADVSVTATGLAAAGVVPCDDRELFAAMFDDLTDDGIGNSARRLAAGTEYDYRGVLALDRTYLASGEILSVDDREGRTGRYQYGTLETRYCAAGGAEPVLTVRTIFAERQTEVVARERPPRPDATDGEPELDGMPVWIPPAYDNRSILDYVVRVDDRNRNHRDDDYARSNGFPSRIASGGMTTNLLGEYVSRHVGIDNVRSISFRLIQPIYPGQVLEVQGRIKPTSEVGVARVDASLSADGRPAAFAVAHVRSPR